MPFERACATGFVSRHAVIVAIRPYVAIRFFFIWPMTVMYVSLIKSIAENFIEALLLDRTLNYSNKTTPKQFQNTGTVKIKTTIRVWFNSMKTFYTRKMNVLLYKNCLHSPNLIMLFLYFDFLKVYGAYLANRTIIKTKFYSLSL